MGDLTSPRNSEQLGLSIAAAHEQQFAVTEILRVVSACKQNPKPVFETILQFAVRLGEVDAAALLLKEGEVFRAAATNGEDLSGPFPADDWPIIKRALLEKVPVQHELGSDAKSNGQTLSAVMVVLAVPILSNADVAGVILLLHTRPISFSSSLLTCLTSFAVQASIAIERGQLFEALDARDRELTVARDHQTSTADVLKIIAQSPGKLEPLLEAIASSALRLCKASDVVIERLEGDRLYNAAHAGTRMKGLVGLPLPLTRQFPGGRAVLDKARVIIDDLMAIAESEYPDTLPLLQINTINSVAEIPLLSDGKPLGTIAVLRAERLPFTESEVALLESYADQAAIAIQNARLFTEIEEKGHLLEAANRHKSQFLATMSHEIRTPMNGVIGMATLLSRTKLDHEQNDFVQTMLRSSEALLAVIDDILDFSKIESGKLELESVPMNLVSVAELALDIVAPIAAKKRIELIYTLGPDMPAAINGDSHRLQQVLLNLLNNAIKFTRTGEVEFAIHSNTSGDGTNEISFEVRDTGIGIPADRIDRLFRSFSQVDASATRRFGGTGLGLAISQSLVQLMGGAISVVSSVDTGSTFRFSLPYSSPNTTPSRTEFAAPVLAGKRILIIDDNESTRRSLVQYTKRWRMIPEAVDSISLALRQLESSREFDLVLIDMDMPDISEVDVLSAMRAARPEQRYPVVLLCPLDFASSEELRGLRATVAAIVSKPIKPGLLHSALAQCFSAPAEVVATADNRLPSLQRIASHAMRILVVDDHATNRKVGAALLKQLGYFAELAGSGAEAVALCQSSDRPFDVALVDIEMPEMDGVDTVTRIRANASSKAPYCIALTANAIVGDRERYLTAGFEDYVPKPIRVEALEAALDRAHRAIVATKVE